MRPLSALLLAGFFVLSTAGAASAQGELEVSEDGRHWSTGLTQPPFDPELVWVPGDKHVADFRIRNNAPTPADFTLTMLGEDTAGLLESDQFRIKARVSGGPWRQLKSFDHGQRLNHVPLNSGSVSTVEVLVGFMPDEGNDTQLQQLSFDFRMQLSEAVLDQPLGDGAATGVDSATVISASRTTTPASVLRALAVPEIGVELLVASALFGAGMAWVLALRRRREDLDQPA